MSASLETPEQGQQSQLASARRKRLLKIGIAVAGLLLFAGFGLAYHMGLLGENFRTISSHQCYRSGQMTPESLRNHVDALGVKCVVNLRGLCTDEWYKNEIEFCRSHNISHVDFKLDPVRLPRPEVAKELIEHFKTGTYPMLMHCRNGMDRSGLAATLYLIIKENETVDAAIDKQLSWHCGHIRTSKNDAAERFFELYRKTGAGESLEKWVQDSYVRIYEKVGPYGGAGDSVRAPATPVQ
jgi:hypothetical protein